GRGALRQKNAPLAAVLCFLNPMPKTAKENGLARAFLKRKPRSQSCLSADEKGLKMDYERYKSLSF
ncbi:MAG: hypothetical protein JW942_04230, partial [Opitutales bacterium]|nr:hypothetical protein [Opitutales bacterium]